MADCKLDSESFWSEAAAAVDSNSIRCCCCCYNFLVVGGVVCVDTTFAVAAVVGDASAAYVGTGYVGSDIVADVVAAHRCARAGSDEYDVADADIAHLTERGADSCLTVYVACGEGVYIVRSAAALDSASAELDFDLESSELVSALD